MPIELRSFVCYNGSMPVYTLSEIQSQLLRKALVATRYGQATNEDYDVLFAFEKMLTDTPSETTIFDKHHTMTEWHDPGNQI